MDKTARADAMARHVTQMAAAIWVTHDACRVVRFALRLNVRPRCNVGQLVATAYNDSQPFSTFCNRRRSADAAARERLLQRDDPILLLALPHLQRRTAAARTRYNALQLSIIAVAAGGAAWLRC